MASGFAAWTGIFSAEGEDWYARDKTHGGRPFRSRSSDGAHLHPNYGDDNAHVAPDAQARAAALMPVFSEKKP